MSKSIIEVIGLSKKYKIFHQGGYFTFRDSFAKYIKNPLSFISDKKSHFSKEDFWVLKDISFKVNQGEVVGLIGRNGAGKTTLLKILSRITYLNAGEVRLRGRVGSLLEVGTGFHGELTGRENIYFNGSILGMKKREIDRKLDEIVAFSGVEKFIDTPVKHFSSGMQVRLAFSVAAHLEPEILLVDEVLAVGDAEFQKKCLGKMKDVSGSGRTIIFVSHNMNAIRTLCSRTVMLEKGRLALDADTETVVSRYLDQNLTIGSSISGVDLESKLEGVIKRGEPSIRLKQIDLLDEDNMPCSTFSSDHGFKICVNYECLKIVNGLRVVIYIVDEENRNLLTTVNVDDQIEVDFYKKEPGVYSSVCHIPANLFGEKRFFVSVHLEYPKVEHLILDRILGFDVVFKGYNSVSAIFKNSFARPRLKWNTVFTERG